MVALFEIRKFFNIADVSNKKLINNVALQSSELAPSARSPASECVPPVPKGRQHALAGEGVGEPIWTIGEKAWHSVYSMVCCIAIASCFVDLKSWRIFKAKSPIIAMTLK